MVNVVVSSQKRVKVTANAAGAVDTNVTLRNSLGYAALAGRLDALNDVYEHTPANGDTLVYHAANDTYVVQQLSIENVANVDVLAIDGGTF